MMLSEQRTCMPRHSGDEAEVADTILIFLRGRSRLTQQSGRFSTFASTHVVMGGTAENCVPPILFYAIEYCTDLNIHMRLYTSSTRAISYDTALTFDVCPSGRGVALFYYSPGDIPVKKRNAVSGHRSRARRQLH